MKWSDGEDFTAADCVFFYDHMCVPEVFGKSLWDCFKVTDPDTGEETIAEFEQIDDTTFTITFQYPKSQFLEELAINAKWCYAPQHYMEQMLPEFIGEDATLEKAQEMDYSDVASMCKNIGYYFWNVPGVPTLNPYILSTEDGKSDVDGEYYEFVRNPYYWKVDQEGNQLPYVDKIEVTKISDDSQKLIKLLAGEVTIAIVDWEDIETVQENAESVGYNILQWQNSLWADLASQLQLNQTVEDDDLRELFQNKDFREALSICVDREEYSKLVSDGWADAKQASSPEGTLGASEEWDAKWTEYDPDKAKELLEGLGLVMGSDGYYTFADGKELVLNITSFTDSGADDTYPVLKQYFDAVGITSTYQPVDKDLLNNRLTTNDIEVVLGPVASAESVSIILRPDTLVPVRNYAAWYGQIGNWYASGGEEGYEPAGDLLELLNLYDELKATTDTEEQQEIGLEMLQLHEDNMWIIGYMGSATTLITVDQNIILLFTYLVSISIGIYSALHQYSVGDYLFSAIGFLGMATPNFLLAIILMYLSFEWTGDPLLGLFSKDMLQNGIHLSNLLDMCKRMIIPTIVIGTAGTCSVIRIVRAQMLDEQTKQYTLTARAKGVPEQTIVYKYCLRAALNPVVSGLAGSLSSIFSGSTISAIVMNIAIQGPVLYEALTSQDMYLAGTILLVQAVLVVIGTLLSDLCLAWLDPRIRYVERS